MHRRLAITLAAAALAGALPACNGSGGGGGLSFLPQDSRLIGQETLDRIKAGETSSDWVTAVMGRPSNVETLRDGTTQIWKYKYQAVGRNSYQLHGRSSDGGTVRTIYLQVASGIVTDKWMD